MIDNFHQPPEGYSYEFQQYKRSVLSVWIINHGKFSYTDQPPRSIWGFYHTKKREYYAPINSKKVGERVNFQYTTPYSAMQLNLNPLEKCLMSL